MVMSVNSFTFTVDGNIISTVYVISLFRCFFEKIKVFSPLSNVRQYLASAPTTDCQGGISLAEY